MKHRGGDSTVPGTDARGESGYSPTKVVLLNSLSLY